MNRDRAVRFVSKGFRGVTLKRGSTKGESLLAGRTSRKAATISNLSRPVEPSPELETIVGHAPLLRSQVVSKVWDHIRKNNLQNPKNKREIVADDKLRKVFGKDRVSMFEMNKHLQRHLTDVGGDSRQLVSAAPHNSQAPGRKAKRI